MMNIDFVNSKLKQRPPFQMIEKIETLIPGDYAKGYKAVSVNEPYFAGHFPGSPIMPGVLVVESAAQLCSVTMEGEADDSKVYVLLKIDQFKFLKPVIPGDYMAVEVKKQFEGGGLFRFAVTVCVGEEVKAKGVLTFTSMKKRIFMLKKRLPALYKTRAIY